MIGLGSDKNKCVPKGQLSPGQLTELLVSCNSCQILFYKFSWPHISHERQITLAQIDARTIKKPLACNANYASLSTDALISVSVQRRILVNPGEVITLFCFHACKLKCAGKDGCFRFPALVCCNFWGKRWFHDLTTPSNLLWKVSVSLTWMN